MAKQKIEATADGEQWGYRKGDILEITECSLSGVRAKNLTRKNHYGRDYAILMFGEFRYLDDGEAKYSTKSKRKSRGVGRTVAFTSLALFSAVIALILGASGPEAYICALLTLIYTEVYGGGAK